jgi:hypothetical protein
MDGILIIEQEKSKSNNEGCEVHFRVIEGALLY